MMDWRDLERERVASGTTIARPTSSCNHLRGNRNHGDDGVGMKRNRPTELNAARFMGKAEVGVLASYLQREFPKARIGQLP